MRVTQGSRPWLFAKWAQKAVTPFSLSPGTYVDYLQSLHRCEASARLSECSRPHSSKASDPRCSSRKKDPFEVLPFHCSNNCNMNGLSCPYSFSSLLLLNSSSLSPGRLATGRKKTSQLVWAGQIPSQSKPACGEFMESSADIESLHITALKSSLSFSFFQAIHSPNRQTSAFL